MQKTPSAGSSRINPLDIKGVFHYNIVMEGFILYQLYQHSLASLADTKIFDCGCGTGDNALLLAEQGSDLTILDKSPDNVAAAVQKFREKGLLVKSIISSIEDYKPDTLYDAVIFTNVFHFIPHEKAAESIDNVLSALKPGGVLVFTDLVDEEIDAIPNDIRKKLYDNLAQDDFSEGVFEVYDSPHRGKNCPHKHLVHFIVGTKK